VATLLDRQGFYHNSRTVRELSVASAHAAGHRVGEASTLVGLGMVQMILGDHVEARKSLEAALRLVNADDNERGQAATLHQLGRLEFTRGNFMEAVTFYSRCLDIAKRTQDDEALCWTHCRIGESLRILNHHDKALVHLRQCQTHAERIGDDSARASSMVEIGSIYRDRGDHQAAAERCEEALKIVEDMPIPDLAIETSACIALANIHHEQHNTETATRYILRAIEVAQHTHDTTLEARAQEVYGDIQFAVGKSADAMKIWRTAIDHYEQIDNVRRVTAIRDKIDNVRVGQGAIYDLGQL
jgi:tetratricopeptide (TPR) repeat protein